MAAALLYSVVEAHFTTSIPVLEANTRPAGADRLSPRVLFIVVDGLRLDTAFDSGWMPTVDRLAAEGASGVAFTTPITMTGVGIRALGAGVSPGLADVMQNWSLPEADFDNVFAQLHARGGKSVVMGNDTWIDLFGPWVETFRSPPEFFKYLNPVYAWDHIIVTRAVRFLEERHDWELAVVHIGGVDNASHMWTPFGEQFANKVKRTDADIATLVLAAGPGTTVIVTSDHGTSDRGQHGGIDEHERRTPLVLHGPGVRAGATLEARQVDIPATVAALLELPVPATIEGRVLVEALDVSPGEARALTAYELDRHRAYAASLSSAHGFAAPVLSSPNDLPVWLARVRSQSTLWPLLWTAALFGCCVLLVFDHVPRLRACGVTWPGRALLLGALEAAMLLWRMHRRTVGGVVKQLGLWSNAVLAGLGAAGLTWLWRVLRRPTVGAGSLFFILLLLSALGEELFVWGAMGAGLIALAALGSKRNASEALALGIAGVLAIQVSELKFPLALIESAGPALVGALAAWSLRSNDTGRLDPAWFVLLVAATGTWVVVTQRGPTPLMLMLAGGWTCAVLASVGLSRRDGARVLGWTAAILLAVLTRGPQVPGLIVWTLAAAVMGRVLLARRNDEAGKLVLAFALACLGFRLGFFAVFEGRFDLGHMEIWLGHVAGPDEHLVGALMVAVKLVLPFVLLLAFMLPSLPPPLRARALAATGAFFGLKVVHVLVGLSFAQGTFYGPYRDASYLLLTLALAASLVIALAVLGLARLVSQKRR